jgi:hypothetical protein
VIAALAAAVLALAPPLAQRGDGGRGAPDPEHASTAPRREAREEDAELLKDLDLLERLDVVKHLELFDADPDPDPDRGK